MNLFNDTDSEVEPFGSDLIADPIQLSARTTETTFDGLLQTPLKLHEDLARGCGGQIWIAGECLSKYVLRNWKAGDVRGKRIVELGAGGGIVGLAVASHFKEAAPEIFITDQEPMMDLMARNTALNELPVKPVLYDWGEKVPEEIADRDVDIVLAADCVYFEPAFPLLEKTLLDLVQEGTVVYFCFKKRRRADIKFMKSITKKLEVKEIKNYEDYEHFSRENVHLYTMRKKAKK